MKIFKRPVTHKTINNFFDVTNTKIGKDLIPTVDARTLWRWLEIGRDFSEWIKSRIFEGRFVENRDYVKQVIDFVDPKNGESKINKIEYHLTLDMAKHLAMMERNDKGFEAREYFIQKEKEANKQQVKSSQPYMPRGYPQMLAAARNDWKVTRKELIELLGIHLNVFDRRRKSQFTNQIYIDLIEATARQLREHFELRHSNQLTRDYLHQLVQECICEIEIRLSDALITGSINEWEEFKQELENLAERVRYMKELQNGRTSLPNYAYPTVRSMVSRVQH